MIHRLILLILLVFFAFSSLAQVSAPARDQTQAAVLADMSSRTGETVTINSLSSQQWYYGTYDFVRNLGCPVAPTTAPTSGNWQRFVFNYRGLDYIYMVSDNLQSLILCNEPSLPTPIPPTLTPTATQQGTGQSGGGVVQPTATLQGFGQSGGGNVQATATLRGSGQSGGGFAATATPSCSLTPRLQINSVGMVLPGEPNWLHAESIRTSEKIGEIPAGEDFTIIAGPVCDAAARMNYWQVEYNGLVGWTSEGLGTEYWLEPVSLGFSPDNVNEVGLTSWSGTFESENWISAISPDSQRIIFGNEEGTLRLIRTDDGSEVGAIAPDSAVTTLSFSANSLWIFVGTESGNLYLLENGALQASTILEHEGSITDAISNSTGTLLLVADSSGVLSFWALPLPDAPLRRIQLPEVAGDLEFSTDNRLLIMRDAEGQFMTALQIP